MAPPRSLGILFPLLLAILALPARGDDSACLKCHAAVAGKAFVHAAVRMGCQACHDELQADVVPHVRRGGAPKGISTSAPELCWKCHDRKPFAAKYAHAPAAAGLCGTCHEPHSADFRNLGRRHGTAACLDCHGEVATKPHVLAGFSGRGHPLGENGERAPADPLRPGQPFYCGSCHEVHGGERPRLLRFIARTPMEICGKCHKL